MADTPNIPIVDISKLTSKDPIEKQHCANEVRKAVEGSGFLLLANHGVDPRVFRNCENVSKEWFENTPLEEKLGLTNEHSSGYSIRNKTNEKGILSERIACHWHDLSDKPLTGPYHNTNNEYTDILFNKPMPPFPHELQSSMVAFHSAMHKVSLLLRRAFALALDMPETFFTGDDPEDISREKNCSRSTVCRYPASAEGARFKPHTDVSEFTLLVSEQPGLQVQHENGIWADVPNSSEYIAVNTGDMMKRWTNGRFKSAIHRVENTGKEKMSLIYFSHPDYDRIIDASQIPACVPCSLKPIAAGNMGFLGTVFRLTEFGKFSWKEGLRRYNEYLFDKNNLYDGPSVLETAKTQTVNIKDSDSDTSTTCFEENMLPSAVTLLSAIRSMFEQDLDEDTIWTRAQAYFQVFLRDPELKDFASKKFPDNLIVDGKPSNLLFYEDPDYGFVLNALVKGPGVNSSVHDHGETFTLYGVLEGGEKILRWERSDDGVGPCKTASLTHTNSHDVTVGHIDFCKPWQVHQECSFDQRTVGIILRSKRSGTFIQNRFDLQNGSVVQYAGPVQIPTKLAW